MDHITPYPFTHQPASGGFSSQLLTQLARSGVLAVAVPASMGGAGGTQQELSAEARMICQYEPAAWAVLRAQRLAIEVLMHTRNVGLREYLLPDLLAGTRAGTVATPTACTPLIGTDTGRGWHLQGHLPHMANLHSAGYTLIAPVQLGTSTGWAALRSEEDGLTVHPPTEPTPAWAAAAHLGELECHHCFFREDEWLGDQTLTAHVQTLEAALHQAQLHT